MKIKFLANKVYHNFSQDIQRLQICKIPKLRMGTLMTLIEHVIWFQLVQDFWVFTLSAFAPAPKGKGSISSMMHLYF